MYCGSCLRDNALASELLARGHDVVLTPVYTPTRTDERNVSQGRVLFGGISVFLEQHAPIFRHTPRIVDRLNVGPIPTNQISWDQPHEGNLFEHLYARRSFQAAEPLPAEAGVAIA